MVCYTSYTTINHSVTCRSTPAMETVLPLGWYHPISLTEANGLGTFFLRWVAPPQSSKEITVPDAWKTGRIWGRRSCDFSKPGTQDCLLGACAGGLECKGPVSLEPSPFVAQSGLNWTSLSLSLLGNRGLLPSLSLSSPCVRRTGGTFTMSGLVMVSAFHLGSHLRLRLAAWWNAVSTSPPLAPIRSRDPMTPMEPLLDARALASQARTVTRVRESTTNPHAFADKLLSYFIQLLHRAIRQSRGLPSL